MADLASGFPPLARRDARVLILGSLPGVRSIAVQQYYAHPHNAFWPIMSSLFGVEGSYLMRCRQLVRHRVALWDVLSHSARPGSLDANIKVDTSLANDLPGFLRRHPHIHRIVFNGRKAEQLFRRFFATDAYGQNLVLIGAPSTSPAYAAMPRTDKLARWAQVRAPICQPRETHDE